ncbi:MAG TPA: hypothetical protein VFD70_27825 [Anaerolineae bacterium]|nr:hypothetical protein [Anaerolineae bacterium]
MITKDASCGKDKVQVTFALPWDPVTEMANGTKRRSFHTWILGQFAAIETVAPVVTVIRVRQL